MTRILKSRYKNFKKTGVRFNARRTKLKLTLNKLNLRLWNNLEFKQGHKKSQHPKYNDTLWRLNFKNKQEIKAFYGTITESAYKKLIIQSKSLTNSSPILKKDGTLSPLKQTKFPLISSLETRLDIVVFRLNWAISVYHAKQLISHGHILVNGNKMKIPSYILKPNDLIQVSNNLQSRKLIKKSIINKLSRINSIIELIYFKRNSYYLGNITKLKHKFEYWLFLPLNLEVDYLTMSAILVSKDVSTPILFPFYKP